MFERDKGASSGNEGLTFPTRRDFLSAGVGAALIGAGAAIYSGLTSERSRAAPAEYDLDAVASIRSDVKRLCSLNFYLDSRARGSYDPERPGLVAGDRFQNDIYDKEVRDISGALDRISTKSDIESLRVLTAPVSDQAARWATSWQELKALTAEGADTRALAEQTAEARRTLFSSIEGLRSTFEKLTPAIDLLHQAAFADATH